ncbi:fused signal recognition particle receptor [Persephonella hydrogeniphila]|uniref:Signal recognition particle receptor FtsY n=1 Tax=Persephonella hydrogeniphila TaxID=198703 RepID=A0A285NH13_9AQUI|nr:signal recognition particle-docking protein FtsY [Persephonella hydrogeniphila]SNZ07176.1 fused signal recognition particle receptor [Persephonella hydrogeniphila]
MFKSMIDKLKSGLEKTKKQFVDSFSSISFGRKIDEELFEDIEMILLKADVGVKATEEIIDFLREESKRRRLKDGEQLKELLKEKLYEILKECESPLNLGEERPAVILFLGINGSGKTTTVGKLAAQFVKDGKSVVLAAADTFRAAAIDQLEVWAERAKARIVKHSPGSDPAAVVYDAVNSAKSRGDDIVLIDTAGRLHTKEHLIKELQKIKRTIKKLMPDQPVETILVLDGTIGQNSINQAKIFKEATDVTGIVITKLDGTAKGGAIIPICKELKIPIKFIGVGEGIEDLQPFDAKAFVDALFD